MGNHLRRMILVLISILTCLSAPPSEATKIATDYIDSYKQIAIIEMHRTGVPASITMAQALHESNKGLSVLASSANNHFGIKCKKYWNGQTYYHKDDDLDSKGKLIDSCFRSYETVIDSYVDHSNFLKHGFNYAFLFNLDRKDYHGWAHGLKKAGYATDPHYAQKLINYIETYGLQALDYEDNPMVLVKTIK